MTSDITQNPVFSGRGKECFDVRLREWPPGYRSDGRRPEIYLKREDLNHTGAHKINNSLGQALMCLRMGKKKIIAETGAGQHGVATVSPLRLQSCPSWERHVLEHTAHRSVVNQ